jgi:hypothetical protein
MGWKFQNLLLLPDTIKAGILLMQKLLQVLVAWILTAEITALMGGYIKIMMKTTF